MAAPIPLKQSTTITILVGPFSTLDGSGAKTGLNVTTLASNLKISKAHAAGAARSSATAMTEDSQGCYFLELNTTDTNTLGRLKIEFVDATNYPVMWMDFEVWTAAKYDGLFGDDTKYIAVDTEQWKGGTIPAVNTTGVPLVDLKYILGTILTEGAGGRIAAAFIKFFNIASSTLTTGGVDQAGDNYTRVGAPVGASISADIAAVKSDTGAVKTQTDKLAFTVANQVDSNVIDWKGATAPAMTGDAYARVGVAGAGLTALGDTRIAHLDADVSTRTKPADTQARVTLVDTVTTYTGNTPQTGDSFARLGAPSGASIDADVLSRLPISSYTAPDNANIGIIATAVAAIKLVTDKFGFTSSKVNAQVQGMDTDVLTAAALKADAVTEIQTGLMTSAGYTAPDNAGIAAINAKTTNLPADPASNTEVDTRLATSGYTAPHNTNIDAIKLKTDNLPNDPASESLVLAGVNALQAHGDSNWPTAIGFSTASDVTSARDSILSKLLKYFQLALRKDSGIATDNAAEVTALNADAGHGAGTFLNSDDAQEAIRDHGDAAWGSGGGFDPTTDPVIVGTNNDKTDYALSSAEHTTLVNHIWDELFGSHTTSGSFGLLLSQIYSKLFSFVGVQTIIASFLDRTGVITIDQNTDAVVTWTSDDYPDLTSAIVTFVAEPTTKNSTTAAISKSITTSFSTPNWSLTLNFAHGDSTNYDTGTKAYRYKVMATLGSGLVKVLERGYLSVDQAIA